MATYANRTCTQCGLRRPQPHMAQKQITQKSGKSGFSMSVSLKPSLKSTRVNSGRNYYRKRQVWVCAENSCHDPSYFVRKSEREERRRLEIAENERLEKERKIEEEKDKRDKDRKVNKLSEDLKNFFDKKTVREKAVTTALQGNKKAEERKTLYTSYVKKSKHSLPKYEVFCQLVADETKSNEILQGTSKVTKPIILDKSNDAINFSGGMHNHVFYKFRHTLWGIPLIFFEATGAIGALCFILYLPSWLCAFPLRNFIGSVRRFEYDFKEDFVSRMNGMARDQFYGLDKTYRKDVLDDYFKDRKWTKLKSPLAEKKPQDSKQAEDKPQPTQEDTKSAKKLRAPSVSKMSLKEIAEEIYEAEDFFDVVSYVLMHKVALADEDLSGDEKLKIKEITKLSRRSNSLTTAFMKEEICFALISKLFVKKFPDDEIVRTELINNLIFIAEADGDVSDTEIMKLSEICREIGVNNKLLKDILNQRPLKDNQVDKETFAGPLDDVFDEFELE